MRPTSLALLPLLFAPAFAQKPCAPVPVWSPCDIALEISEESARKHPNPYLTVEVWAEIRSPEYRTYRLPAFWNGGRNLIVRFAPTQPGEWTFRISGNLPEFDEKTGRVTAVASDHPGFIRPANVHHWIHPATLKPHLYVGDTNYGFAYLPRAEFDAYLVARAKQKFTHVRGLVISDWHSQKPFASPDQPDPAFFSELDTRVRAMNERGILADLILAGDRNAFVKNFPEPAQRERYLRYMVGRYAAMNITWQLVQEFEEYDNGKALMRDIGTRLRALDPYDHPRTAHAVTTSSPLLGDGWQDHVLYQTSIDAIGAIEHQLFPFPQVNSEFGYENSGAGASHPHHVDSDAFRKRLWNATMNGQYPVFGNTGTYGGRQAPFNASFLESPGAKAMTAWIELMQRTRYWELEPYFDVENCRAVALPDVEYLAYIEKPGAPVEITVEKHEYQVYWINPSTGETIKEKKDWKGDVFTGTPPDKERDWVLHLSRDGRKEGMARSYKFESRRNLMQEVESDARLIPFDLAVPKTGDTLEAGAEVPFRIQLKKTTPGTRRMMYAIAGEIVRDGQGPRILATGSEGTLKVPADLLKQPAGVVNMRVFGLNAPGKLYSLDLIYPVKRP